jgi:hypothetical protein
LGSDHAPVGILLEVWLVFIQYTKYYIPHTCLS